MCGHTFKRLWILVILLFIVYSHKYDFASGGHYSDALGREISQYHSMEVRRSKVSFKVS